VSSVTRSANGDGVGTDSGERGARTRSRRVDDDDACAGVRIFSGTITETSSNAVSRAEADAEAFLDVDEAAGDAAAEARERAGDLAAVRARLEERFEAALEDVPAVRARELEREREREFEPAERGMLANVTCLQKVGLS